MAKRVCLYGILTAVCLVLGYIESVLSLSFIAPAVKLGLANSVALLLILKGDIKGAFAVNITRILLSALLFATPFSLVFSLSAGIVSLIIMCIFSKIKVFSAIGFSIWGAIAHNLTQLCVAFVIFGKAVVYYSPFLLVSALLSGGLVGFLCGIIYKKIKLK